MTLKPHQDVLIGWLKVHKHVFERRQERWWELLDGGLEAWQADRATLGAAGCLDGLLERRPARSAARPSAAAVMTRRHGEWLSAANRAVSEAINARHVFAQANRCWQYIGAEGVVVVVAGHNQLVTCFRDPRSTAAAVRAATRRASLSQPPPSDS